MRHGADRHGGEVAPRGAGPTWWTVTPTCRATKRGSTTCFIPSTPRGPGRTTPSRRKRKLLLHKLEIRKIESKVKETGHTLVPLSLYFKDGRVKLELALAVGQEAVRQAQTLREKQDRRESDRAVAAARKRAAGLIACPGRCLRVLWPEQHHRRARPPELFVNSTWG
ncbi:hypothetical protein GCM10020229_14890 [Kitasatospora albolonga]